MTTKLLVVDDDEAILRALSRFFSRKGFEVDSASEVEEAQALISNYRYAAVIADLRMTGSYGVEGLTLLSYFRRRCPESRFLLLTAFASAEIEEDARSSGADEVLSKPIPLNELYEIVRALLPEE